MQKDITQKRLQSYPDVAADLINASVYNGKSVVKAEELVLLPAVEYGRDMKGVWHERWRDIVHGWKYAIFGFENQMEVDNTAPLRFADYDIRKYQEQVRLLMDQNKEENREAYVKRIHDDQKLQPVVTIVFFYGSNWTGPRSIRDMLEPENRAELEPFLLDYEINLVELGKDKDFYKKFHSDFRPLVRFLSVKNDSGKLKEYYNDKEDTYQIRHVEEFLDVMESITSDARYQKIKEKYVSKIKDQKKEETFTMCMLLDLAEETGEKRINDLNRKLLEDGRISEMIEAVGDETLQRRLFKEYGL